MNKFYYLLLFLFFLSNCSFDTKSGFWTQEQISETNNEKILFQKEEININELNPDLIIKLGLDTKKNNILNGNNQGIVSIKSDLLKISKFKFKKNNFFNKFAPEIIFINNDLIFFEKNGTIIRINEKSEVVWKKNYYSKKEKKNNPILKLTKINDKILVTDNLSKIYLLNANNGNLGWETDHNVNFVSEIKAENDYFFALDALNNFNCFSLINGALIWDFKAEDQLINSQKQTSIIYDEDQVIFNNAQNKIVSLSKNGNLLWITPTISFEEEFQSYLIDNSDLVLDNQSIFFSNNANSFYAINSKTGVIKWKQKINSNLKPIVVDNVIFTISSNRYLNIIDKNNGNIIRVTDILKNFKQRKIDKMKITGFLVSEEKIFITTDNGNLIIADIATGKADKVYKISRDSISRPYVNNNKLYFMKKNEIIKMK